MATHNPDTIAGITVPDSSLAREAAELVRDTEEQFLFDHSRRVFLFGALHGRHRQLTFDPELLYVAALFHDLGLTERYRSSMVRFEVDGADAARDFLARHGVGEADARKVWLSIALHTTPGIPEFLDPEVALITAGVETDNMAIGKDDLAADDIAAVTAAHPRPNFKRCILQAFTDGTRHRPQTTHGTINSDVLEHYEPSFVRDDYVETILACDWPE